MLVVTEVDIDCMPNSGEHYLGYDKHSMKGVSLYSILHPDSVKEVQSKHRLSKKSARDCSNWIGFSSTISLSSIKSRSPRTSALAYS